MENMDMVQVNFSVVTVENVTAINLPFGVTWSLNVERHLSFTVIIVLIKLNVNVTFLGIMERSTR